MSGRLSIQPLGASGLQRIAVTGANGFVGRALCAALAARGVEVTALVRAAVPIPGATRVQTVGDFTAVSDWKPWLAEIDAVVHLAALTHAGTRGANAARFHAVNVEVSRRLAEAARACGIQRFVYLSSIKVNGESSTHAHGGVHAFSASDTPAPEDDYGRSKLATEQLLAQLCGKDVGALTILRPPLVYGPGQQGNLPRLMTLVARELPLPFGALTNRRSLIYVENLVAAIVNALGVASPGVRCYTVADVEVSTPALVRVLAHGLGVQAHLLNVPPSLLRALTCLPGVGASVRRLTDNLLVDARAAERELGWHPHIAFADAIALTCSAWREARR